MRQTQPQGHFGYSTHGQGNGAVVQMDDNTEKRGNQWVGIGYTTNTNTMCKKNIGLSFGVERARGGRGAKDIQ